jgi:hypothetical protein
MIGGRCGYSAPLAVGAIALASFAMTSDAWAKPGVPTIVLESHVGHRSAESDAAMHPVLDELERLGFAARPQSIERLLGGRAPRPGRLDEGRSVTDIKQLIALGRSAFDKAKFDEAEAALRGAVDLIRRNPALLVLDTNNEKVAYSAYVGLSLALFKLKRRPEATEVMLELLRMSSTPIPQAEYGPKAEEIHSDAEKEAQTLGRGSLTISVDDSRAMIFLDQKFRGIGNVALGDLIVGTHHVLVQIPGTGGLQYVRTVQASKPTELDINWRAESQLHLDANWAGFVFATELERQREVAYAHDFGRRFGGADVILLRTMQLDGRPYIVGTQYPADGGAPIGAFAPVDAGEPLLRSLARYLYDGTVAAGLRVLQRTASDAPSVALAASRSHNGSLWVPLIGLGAGGATIGIGAVVYARNPYDPAKPAADDGRDPFVGLMLGGAGVIGVSVYLLARETTSASRLSATLLGTGSTAIAAGALFYLTDQDPGPDTPKFVRDTSSLGIGLGAAGLAVAGTGLWLLHRESAEERAKVTRDVAAHRRRNPRTISVAVSRSFVGAIGTY